MARDEAKGSGGEEPRGELERVLGFRTLLFIAMGQIIGAGVVALTGVAIGMTGPSVVLAYPMAALFSIVVSLPAVIAGGVLPSVGAFYVWTARLVGPWVGSGVLMLILLASISLGLYGTSIGLYLNPIFPFLSVNGWGSVVLLALFGANLFGLRMAAGVQSFLVLVLLSALAIYAGIAIPKVDAANLDPMLPHGVGGFLAAVFLLKFATSGAHLVVGLGGEVENAERTLPRVILVATLIVAIFYAAIALAAVGVVPWESMVNQPLTVAGEAFLPGWALTYFLVGGAGVAIGTTLNAQFIQLPRNFMVAAWDGLLPASIGRLNRHGAPWVILSVMAGIGLVPLIAGLDISAIARATSIAATLPALFVYWAVTRIPKAYPERYARSLLRPGPFGMGALFVFCETMAILGVILLGRDLPAAVAIGLAGGFVLSFGWYPIRKRALARQGIDLDAKMRDPAIMLGP